MVFLEDVVNLPTQQIANILLAAHFRKKLKKKDINKTKLGTACEQLHTDRTKKPMPLRHYGQCLVGISWIHFKQVEFLHNDCNEAFAKVKIAFRKRNVDLDPSKDRARDITLPANYNKNNNNHNGNGEGDFVLEMDENMLNLSQLMIDVGDEMISDNGSLMGSTTHDHVSRADNLDAAEHEITMNINNNNNININDRRSSFGALSSVLGHDIDLEDTHDMDIEIKFDDDDDVDMIDNLDESQAKRSSLNDLDLNLTDDDRSVEHGRGAINDNTLLQIDNISDIGSVLQQQQKDGSLIDVMDDNGSTVSLQKENEPPNLADDAMSASVVSHNQQPHVSMMDIDADNQSLHVQFDDNVQEIGEQSVGAASITTASLLEAQEKEQTPPTSPRSRSKSKSKSQSKSPSKDKKKSKLNKKKKSRKNRFQIDKIIEFERNELRDRNEEMFPSFTYPTQRDSLHIWREFPLYTLDFDELFNQPLSKDNFGKLPSKILEKFKFCNYDKKTMTKVMKKNNMFNINDDDNNNHDELSNINILRDENDEVEQGRDYASDQAEHDNDNDIELNLDLDLPANDIPLNMDDIDQIGHKSINEPQLNLNNIDDDNGSVLDSVVDDSIAPPDDVIFNEQNISIAPINEMDEEDEDEDEDIDIKNDDIDDNDNRLTFDSNDHEEFSGLSQQFEGIKFREWSRRTKKTFSYFQHQKEKQFSFNNIMQNTDKRETACGIFYELLVFKNQDLVELKQDIPFGDITITKTAQFDRHARISKRYSQSQRQ